MNAEEQTKQRTAEWFAQRVGCLTASKAGAVLSRQKNGKPYSEYFRLIDDLVTERITGSCTSIGVTPAMQWGIDHENEARNAYEAITGNTVVETGFVRHPTVDGFGASPDGLVDDDGLVEIKCPNTITHLQRVLKNEVPSEYVPQMMVQLLCTGRKYVDFIDYDPRLSGKWKRHTVFIKRFQPTEEELNDALNECVIFLQKVDEKYKSLCKLIE